MHFRRYMRRGTVEAGAWIPGVNMAGVSISEEDRKAGSPKEGDMIARNPDNHADKWLIAHAFFRKNYIQLDPAQEK